MLPGGVDVLGLYIISPSQPKCHKELKEALSGVFKTLAKYQTLSPVSQEKERPILHLQPSSNKYTCKTFDITDSKGPGAGKTVEWKKAPSPLSWRQLEAQLGLDHRLTVPARQSRASLLRQLETSLEPLMAALLADFMLVILEKRRDIIHTMRSDALTFGYHLECSILLDISGQSKEGYIASSVCVCVDLSHCVVQENSQEVQVVESSAEMQIKGTVQGRAFVRPQATVGEAIQALKQDIFRSLLVRLEIQCGDLLAIDEEHHDPEVIHELPHRAHAPLPHSGGLTVCDYLFHGDSPSDSIQVFHDLLYISVSVKKAKKWAKKFVIKITLMLSFEKGRIKFRMVQAGGGSPAPGLKDSATCAAVGRVCSKPSMPRNTCIWDSLSRLESSWLHQVSTWQL
ncbi:C1orf27 [Cordylochernes scorpioides]|uniref:C1orf27 n=1 Tax=Cordylochernes scorpioides TaxID=51811 RepID=A0ABY6K873_9ARAC|nr:C1orf27 [Cordylochernes scorpioides]